MDSLATLASLRPRCHGDDHSPLIPSPAVLRKLHRSLALEPSAGWYGNLPPSRATALHDDSTIKVKSPTITPAAPVNTMTPISVAPSSQVPVAAGYSSYGYNYSATPQQQQQAYRQPATFTQYKPGQTNYYQPYVPAATQQSYFNPQSYGATSHQQAYGSGGGQTYPYGATWYNQYQHTAAKPGTPIANVATPTSYNTFFAGGTAANGAAPSRTPAVANTVANKVATPQTTGWATPTYQPTGIAPTIPSHLRTSQPSTPTPAYQPPGTGYYQTYPMQASTSAAPSR